MSTEPAFSFPGPLLEVLRAAQRITVLTGAGISAESGLPTFRDKLTGLWERYNLDDLVTTEGLRRDPGLVWDWFAEMREAMEQAQPNPAHLALVEMERHVAEFTLVTQNIDGLHQRAGSSTVHELHGNIFRTICNTDRQVVASWLDTGVSPPRCPRCNAILRPDVVLFGEMLPQDAWIAAASAAPQSDVFFAIGTSGVVEPAASLAHYAMLGGAVVVQINLDVKTGSSGQVYAFNARAGQILPALVAAAWG